MDRIFFSLYPDQVKFAQGLLDQGFLGEAAHLTWPVNKYLGKDIQGLYKNDQPPFLQATVIHTKANISLSRKSWDPRDAGHYLKNAGEVLKGVYINPSIQEVSKTINKDIEGKPFNFSTEMVKNKINYLLLLSTLSGDANYLNLALEIIKESGLNKSEFHSVGSIKKLSWEVFKEKTDYGRFYPAKA